MKTNYFYAVVFGIMVLTNTSRSQNILFDGEFSQTTQIIAFDTLTPLLNTWTYRVNEYNGAEATPSVVDGVAKIQIPNPGYDYPDVQLTQVGFPLNQRHVYQLSFDVKADSDRYVRIFLGEEGGSATNLIGYDKFWYDVTTGWQTISLEFITTSVFELHKLGFELGGNGITTYFDNVILQDLGPVPPEKVVIAGTFQSAMGCETDWDANCEITELTFDSSTDLYSGTFEIPEGNHRYKVAVGGSWDINYGENGFFGGADIYLCLPAGPEEVSFTYDPVTHLVTTSPMTSGFSPDCLPIVVLSGSFQEELGCSSDWMSDCSNTALTYNTESGLFEGDFNIPPGCYYYRIYLENSLFNSFGQDGIFNGANYGLYIPKDSEITHFTYDPISHVVRSSPYGNPPQEVTQVFLMGNLQEELGCHYNGEFDCEKSSLVLSAETGTWENSFVLPEGCYTYRVREIFGCEIETLYGQDGEPYGEEIQLYVPEDREIQFRYDPETHLIESTPFSEVPQEVTKVSLNGSFQQAIELVLNSESGNWENTSRLSTGCYTYVIEETFGCNTINFYGENGVENGREILLYVPMDGEITFTYDPEIHLISSTPYSAPEISKVSLTGTIQEVLCAPDYYDCDKSALMLNPETGMWEGNFILPKGCYTYQVQEDSACITASYGENGELGGSVQLYIPEEGEVSFSYDPQTHIIISSPYSGTPQEVTAVSLEGSSLQNELILNPDSGFWEGSLILSTGCYTYQIKETFGCVETYYGENGNFWPEIQLYVPTEAEISFSYNPQTHLITSTPYSGNPEEATAVSIEGSSFQNELMLNADSGLWEGNFTFSEGCYTYWVKESIGCNDTFYGENDRTIQLYVPSEGDVTFSYDPQTHTMTSTPYSGVPQEITSVSFFGDLQNELGCSNDNDSECDEPALIFNPDSGAWEGTFNLPAKCYSFLVKEKFTCSVSYYGENGNSDSPIQLYVPVAGDISFSYDPHSHILTTTPYYPIPEEVTAVSLVGSLQNELGCVYDDDQDCDNPALLLNPESGAWEGRFILPAGCYSYRVKERFGCETTLYGENGEYYWPPIELYVPTETEITFSYDPQTHLIISTPYSGNPEEITSVSLEGSLQNELILNTDTGLWESSSTLSEGCYTYRVRETIGCEENYYGENGEPWPDIELFVPTESEITFIYDPATHIITTSPYSGIPEEVTSVSLYGYFSDSMSYPTLTKNETSGNWEGKFELPAGCYTYWVEEILSCWSSFYYGENGIEWSSGGKVIQLYIPESSQVNFSYDPQTHIMTSSPYSGAPQEVTKVSISMYPNDLTLSLNSDSGDWEGSLDLAAGCYYYDVRETFGCEETSYGGNQFYMPLDGEITFRYDPQTHNVISSPYSGVPDEVTNVNLVGSLDEQYGSIPLTKNQSSGKWEGIYMAPAGCYAYMIEEVFGCTSAQYFGQNGVEWGEEIPLFVPSETEITFSYDPETHLITSLPDIPNVNQCPEDIIVDNTPDTCGAVVEYPDFTATAECGGEIVSATQTEGLPSGSLFPIGTTTNTYVLTNTTGEIQTCSFDVVVTDSEAPVIADLRENYEPLWPPNNKMVPVFIEYIASDNCSILKTDLFISSNESESGPGKGNSAPDWEVVDEHNVLLRAERDARGTGREYYIIIRVTDDSGNFSEQNITITVPRDNSKRAEEDLQSGASIDEYILYPNAADDVINIRGPKSCSGYSYAIFDMLGVRRQQGTVNNDQIEVINLPSGTYFLRFGSKTGDILKQFIKN